MSTAGKVLTVLVLLVTLVWLVLMSAVTQLNVNWEAQIDKQQESLDNATIDLERTKLAASSKTEEARAKQDETERELRVKLTQIAADERKRSSKIEDLTRLKAQVADAQEAVETAKKNQTTRETEKVANEESLAQKRDEIAKAQALNADLKNQLAQLQDQFKRILADNAAKLSKIAKEGTAVPASRVRDSSPSS